MSLKHMLKTSRTSLRFRLLLLITLLTTVLTISFTSYFVLHEKSTQTSQLVNKGNLLTSILSNSIQIPLYAGNDEEVAMLASQLFANGDICALRIFNRKRELIISALSDYDQTVCNELTVTKSLFSNSNQFSPESLLLGEEPPDTLTGVIELELDTGQLKNSTNKLVLASSLLGLAFWLAATTITFFLLKRLTATFELLMSGVKKIEKGDLSARIPVTGTDEPERALSAINSLAETLQRKTEENERLQGEVVKGLSLQIDEEKTRHMAKLIQTNRMTSLGLLVSSMAHEINNPNSAIRLAAEILERGWKDVQPVLNEVAKSEGEFKICGMTYSDAIEDIEKAVDAIMRSSVRIETVVQNLRTYSLGDREKQLMPFDLNRVAENSVAIVMAHGKMERIIINMDLSPHLPFAIGNPFQLEQVVINLLLNAIQALSLNDGKTINLATRMVSESGELLLVVTDSGPGITAANLPHIFEPFFSTKIDNGGSGLGLYIADFIMKEQNGRLKIENIEGGGCRAEIRLPAAKSASI